MVLVFFYTHLWKDEIIVNHVSKAVMLKLLCFMHLWAVGYRQDIYHLQPDL